MKKQTNSDFVRIFKTNPNSAMILWKFGDQTIKQSRNNTRAECNLFRFNVLVNFILNKLQIKRRQIKHFFDRKSQNKVVTQ